MTARAAIRRSHGGRTLKLFGFGPHLMIDGYHASAEKLENRDLVRHVLKALPSAIELTKVSPSDARHFTGLREEDGGVSGVALLAESHIAIHTFPKRGFLSVDVFSCTGFDAQKAVDYLVEHFEMGRYDTHLINRGKEFPSDAEDALRIVSGEREYVEARLG